MFSKKGEELIKQWMDSTTQHIAAKQAEARSSCEALNAANALGKWLMPGDAEVGEKFSVWYGDSLIEVTVTHHDPQLRIRKLKQLK